MPLTVSTGEDGDKYVTGATRNGPAERLGPRSFPVGKHVVGFDDRFAEPALVRAYWDASTDPAVTKYGTGAFDYLGYLQFSQVNFVGVAIPPSVLGGRLADRDPYVYGKDLRFLDFMGPKDARESRVIAENTPFYAVNSMLKDGAVSSLDSLTRKPSLNGSLLAGKTVPTGDGVPLCPSLIAEVAPGLLTEKQLAEALKDRPTLKTIPVSVQQLADSEPYQIAVAWLTENPLDGLGRPLLYGIPASKIWAQCVGPYVLLTPPDAEEFGPTLVICLGDALIGRNVLVYYLSSYEMLDLTGTAARNALWRIRAHLDAERWTHPTIGKYAPERYGTSPRVPLPFTLKPRSYVVELKYWTIGTGARLGTHDTRTTPGLVALSGFTWSALLELDSVTNELLFSTFRAPEPATYPTLRDAMDAYTQAVFKLSDEEWAKTTPAVIDTSNFTQAAMRRDGFATRGKARYVDARDRPVL